MVPLRLRLLLVLPRRFRLLGLHDDAACLEEAQALAAGPARRVIGAYAADTMVLPKRDRGGELCMGGLARAWDSWSDSGRCRVDPASLCANPRRCARWSAQGVAHGKLTSLASSPGGARETGAGQEWGTEQRTGESVERHCVCGRRFSGAGGTGEPPAVFQPTP